MHQDCESQTTSATLTQSRHTSISIVDQSVATIPDPNSAPDCLQVRFGRKSLQIQAHNFVACQDRCRMDYVIFPYRGQAGRVVMQKPTSTGSASPRISYMHVRQSDSTALFLSFEP